MKYLKVIVICWGVVLLLSCNELFETGECMASTVSGGATSFVSVNCEDNPTPQILTKKELQEL